jgi:hypothetical protein
MKTEMLLQKMGRMKAEPPELEGSCPEPEKLEALQAGRLSESERERVEAHLAACPACMDVLLTLREPVPSLGGGTVRRILAATEPARQVQRLRVPGWAVGGLVAAALVLILVLPRGPRGELPPYDLSVAGELKLERGGEPEPAPRSPGEVPVYGPESDLVLRLAPAQGRTGQAPVVAAYLRQADGVYHRIQPAPSIDRDPESGLIELRVRAGDLLETRYGRHSLAVALLPAGADAPARLDGARPEVPGGRVLVQELEYRAP